MALLRASMGWDDDPRYDDLVRWKHDENPFGPSPAWVAVDGSRIAGFRTFLRWEWERNGEVVRAVRAVDTATDPNYQGRGIFTRLTTLAVDELRSEGIAFVFNTPNEQSRPGYLKMGWRDVGRLPVSVRPRPSLHMGRLLQARAPAGHWSEDTRVGQGIETVLTDESLEAALLHDRPGPDSLRTCRAATYLRWRYGLDHLKYRVLYAGDRAEDGFAIVRLRRRGASLELAVVESFAIREQMLGKVVARALGDTGADYGIRLGASISRAGFVPVPRIGPRLTWRALADESQPPADAWSVTLGDIELF
jgi:GNAT superfamily N-acetyltransferase